MMTRNTRPQEVIELSSDDDEAVLASYRRAVPTTRKRRNDRSDLTDGGAADSLQISDVLPLLHSSVDVRYEKRRPLNTTTTTADRIKNFTGHEFIPLGYMQSVLINLCKEQCRKTGDTMLAVTDNWQTEGSSTSEISRVGYLFPKTIVESVREKAGRRVAQLERIVGVDTRGVPLDKSVEPKTAIQIRKNIKDIFPSMPELEVAMVANRAWDKKRIGREETISLALRIQLAVSSHIRHVHTNYDEILTALNKKDPHLRMENRRWIRQQLEPEIVNRMKRYRGEHDDQLQEAWREIMVVSDESDNEAQPSASARPSLVPGMVLYGEDGEPFTVGPEDMALPTVERVARDTKQPITISDDDSVPHDYEDLDTNNSQYGNSVRQPNHAAGATSNRSRVRAARVEKHRHVQKSSARFGVPNSTLRYLP